MQLISIKIPLLGVIRNVLDEEEMQSSPAVGSWASRTLRRGIICLVNEDVTSIRMQADHHTAFSFILIPNSQTVCDLV